MSVERSSWATSRAKWKEWMHRRPKGRRLTCPQCHALIVFGDVAQPEDPTGEERVEFWHEAPHCSGFREVIGVLVEMNERTEPTIDRNALVRALQTVDTRRVERLKLEIAT